MSIELPDSGTVFFPEVPSAIAQSDPALYEFLQRMKKELETRVAGAFLNMSILAAAMNSGTSGTFTISSGGSIVVTSGIVITVTS